MIQKNSIKWERQLNKIFNSKKNLLITSGVLLVIVTVIIILYNYISGFGCAPPPYALYIEDINCDPSTKEITIWISNHGGEPIDLNNVKISGTDADGNAISEISCMPTVGTISRKGKVVQCTNKLIGSSGYNPVKVSMLGARSVITDAWCGE